VSNTSLIGQLAALLQRPDVQDFFGSYLRTFAVIM
jgi:hypothetical protein